MHTYKMSECVVCYEPCSRVSTCACKGSMKIRCERCEKKHPVCLTCRRPNCYMTKLYMDYANGEPVEDEICEQLVLVEPADYRRRCGDIVIEMKGDHKERVISFSRVVPKRGVSRYGAGIVRRFRNMLVN